MSKFDHCDFYTHDQHPEILQHEHLGDAIGEYVDNHELVDIEEEVEFFGFDRYEVTDADEALLVQGLEDFIHEWMNDDERGSPEDSGFNDVTDEIRAAIATLASVTRKDTTAWSCTKVDSKVIDMRAWIAEHEPELLAEWVEARRQRLHERTRSES